MIELQEVELEQYPWLCVTQSPTMERSNSSKPASGSLPAAHDNADTGHSSSRGIQAALQTTVNSKAAHHATVC